MALRTDLWSHRGHSCAASCAAGCDDLDSVAIFDFFSENLPFSLFHPLRGVMLVADKMTPNAMGNGKFAISVCGILNQAVHASNIQNTQCQNDDASVKSKKFC